MWYSLCRILNLLTTLQVIKFLSLCFREHIELSLFMCVEVRKQRPIKEQAQNQDQILSLLNLTNISPADQVNTEKACSFLNHQHTRIHRVL